MKVFPEEGHISNGWLVLRYPPERHECKGIQGCNPLGRFVGHPLRGRELIHRFLKEMRTDLKNSCDVQDYWDHELI